MCYITPKEFTCCFVQSNSSQNASYASNVTFMRLSILDAPQAALTGTALEKQKEVVKTGKAALDKLMNEAKKVLVKVSDKEDEVFKDLCLWYVLNRFLILLHGSWIAGITFAEVLGIFLCAVFKTEERYGSDAVGCGQRIRSCDAFRWITWRSCFE